MSIIKGTYHKYIEGFDWGAAVTDVTLSLESPLENVTAESFKVTETKETTVFVPPFPVEVLDFERKVTGVRTEDGGKKIIVSLNPSPSEGSPFLFSMNTMLNSWAKPYTLKFELTDREDTLELEDDGTYNSSADAWKYGSYSAKNGTVYQYAYYKPEKETKNLVIWLHGLGEGGTVNTDPAVTILANKVTALSSAQFQETVGNAHIFAPQCPTFWMDSKGDGSTLSAGRIAAGRESYYTASLTELLKYWIDKVKAEKVVLAGCSNGGYMTVLLAADEPELFDGIVPLCEAMPFADLSEADIENLAKLPSYYVFSYDDDVVDPKLHEIPLLKVFKEKGMEKLYVSTTEHVIDTSGRYSDAEGNPHKYSGHWCWIYFFNNECDADGYKAWDFVRDCLK